MNSRRFYHIWICLLCLFPALVTAQTLTQYEYWFDDGFDNRITMGLSGTEKDITAGLDTRSLGNGLHQFFLRLKQSDGMYSPITSQYFFKAQVEDRGALEYWFDDNRSGCKRIASHLASDGQAYIVNATIDVTNISAGYHRFYYRFVNEDGSVCSATSMTPVVIGMRYFTDIPSSAMVTRYRVNVDGVAKDFDINEPGHDVEISHVFDASKLEQGLHVLNVTFWNSDGYSVTDRSTFYVRPAGMRLFKPDEQSFRASNITETGFKASWDAVPDAIYYDIKVKPVGGSYEKAVFDGGSTEPFVNVTGLDAGQSYQFQVRARNDNYAERSEWSGSIPTAVTTAASGTIPANLLIYRIEGFDGTANVMVDAPNTYSVMVMNRGTSAWTGHFYLKEGDQDIKAWYNISLDKGGGTPLQCSYTPTSVGQHELTLYYQTNGKGHGSLVKAGSFTNPMVVTAAGDETYFEGLYLKSAIVCPSNVELDAKTAVSGIVANNGTDTWKGTLYLMVDDVVIDSRHTSIKRNEQFTLSSTWTPKIAGEHQIAIAYKNDSTDEGKEHLVKAGDYVNPVISMAYNADAQVDASMANISFINKDVVPQEVTPGSYVYCHFHLKDNNGKNLRGMKLRFKCENQYMSRALETDASDDNGYAVLSLMTDGTDAIAARGETAKLKCVSVINEAGKEIPFKGEDDTDLEYELKIHQGTEFSRMGFENVEKMSVTLDLGVEVRAGNTAGALKGSNFNAHFPATLGIKWNESGDIKECSLEGRFKAGANIKYGPEFDKKSSLFDKTLTSANLDFSGGAYFRYSASPKEVMLRLIMTYVDSRDESTDWMQDLALKAMRHWYEDKRSEKITAGWFADLGAGVNCKLFKAFPGLENVKLFDTPIAKVTGLDISGKVSMGIEESSTIDYGNNLLLRGYSSNLKASGSFNVSGEVHNLYDVAKAWWRNQDVQLAYMEDKLANFYTRESSLSYSTGFGITHEQLYDETTASLLKEVSQKINWTTTWTVSNTDIFIGDWLPFDASLSYSNTSTSKLVSKGDFAVFLADQAANRVNKKQVLKVFPNLSGQMICAPQDVYTAWHSNYEQPLSILSSIAPNPTKYKLSEALKMEHTSSSKAEAAVNIRVYDWGWAKFYFDVALSLGLDNYPNELYYSVPDRRFLPTVLRPVTSIKQTGKHLVGYVGQKIKDYCEEEKGPLLEAWSWAVQALKCVIDEGAKVVDEAIGDEMEELFYLYYTHYYMNHRNNAIARHAMLKHPRLAEKEQVDICRFALGINRDAVNFEKGVKIHVPHYYPAGDLLGITDQEDTLFVVSEVCDIIAIQGTDTLETTQQGKFALKTTIGIDDLTPFGFSESTPLDVYHAAEGSTIWHYVGPAGSTLMVDSLGAYMIATSIKNDLLPPTVESELDGQTNILRLHISDNIALKVNSLRVMLNGEERDVTVINSSNFEVPLTEADMANMLTLYVSVYDMAGNQGTHFQMFNIDKTDNIDIVKENEDQTMVRLSKDLLKVEGAQPDVRIMLFALNGTIMAQGQTDTYGRAQLHLNHLSSGVYIVTLSNGKSKKFVIK